MMLLDSNIIIYAVQPQYENVRQFIAENAPYISVISKIEVLGYYRLDQESRQLLEEFFNAAEILPLGDSIVNKAIELRQQRKISLGDSIVAATALVHGLTLVTRNTQDFKWVNNLNLIDPFE